MILEMIFSEFIVLMNDDFLEFLEEIWLGVGVGFWELGVFSFILLLILFMIWKSYF